MSRELILKEKYEICLANYFNCLFREKSSQSKERQADHKNSKEFWAGKSRHIDKLLSDISLPAYINNRIINLPSKINNK